MSLWQLQALLRHFWRHEPAGHAVGAELREQSKRSRRTVLCRPGFPVVEQRARPASGPDSATIRLVEMRSGNTPSTADFTIPMVPELCSAGLVGCRLQ